MTEYYFLIFTACFVLFDSSLAHANTPIGAAILLAYPNMTYISSSAIALFIAIFVETAMFSKKSKISIYQTFPAILVANIFSAIFGILIVASFSFGAIFFIMVPILTLCLGKMFKSATKSVQGLKTISNFMPLIFFALFLISLLLGTILLSITDLHIQKIIYFNNSFIILISPILLVLIGFIFTCTTEAFIINKMKSCQNISNELIINAVIIMNMASYTLLSVIYEKDIFNYVMKVIL